MAFTSIDDILIDNQDVDKADLRGYLHNREIINIKDFGAVSSVVGNSTDALKNAITAASVLGRAIQVPAGTYLITPRIDVADGVSIIGEPGAVFQLTDQDNAALRLQGNNTLRNLTIIGVRGGATSGGNQAIIRIQGAQNVRLENVHTFDSLGDGVYFQNTAYVWIDKCRFMGNSRNGISINDDGQGSQHVWISNSRIESYGAGIAGESDDDTDHVHHWYLSDLIVRGLTSPYAGNGIYFSKSQTQAAGPFRKYTHIYIHNVTVENYTVASIFRGADNIFVRGYSAVNCADGFQIGANNTVSNFYLSDFDLDVAGTGIAISFGPVEEPNHNIHINDGRIKVSGGSSPFGVFSQGTNVHIDNVDVDMGGIAGSQGIRLQTGWDENYVTNCRVTGAKTSGIQVSIAGTERGGIIDNVIDCGAGACDYGIRMTGAAGADITVTGNRTRGWAAIEMLQDDKMQTARFNNIGSDRFFGFLETTDATPTSIKFRGAGYIPLVSGRSMAFEAHVTYRRQGSTIDCGYYILRGLLKNQSGTVSLTGTVSVTVVGESDAGADVTATADSINGLVLTATGVAGKTLTWNADVRTVVM